MRAQDLQNNTRGLILDYSSPSLSDTTELAKFLMVTACNAEHQSSTGNKRETYARRWIPNVRSHRASTKEFDWCAWCGCSVHWCANLRKQGQGRESGGIAAKLALSRSRSLGQPRELRSSAELDRWNRYTVEHKNAFALRICSFRCFIDPLRCFGGVYTVMRTAPILEENAHKLAL